LYNYENVPSTSTNTEKVPVPKNDSSVEMDSLEESDNELSDSNLKENYIYSDVSKTNML
jgi:hypothetical protein